MLFSPSVKQTIMCGITNKQQLQTGITTYLCSYGNELATEYTFNPYGLVTRIHTGNKLLCTSGNDLIKGGVAYFCAADSAILNYRYACNSNTGLMGSRSERIVNRQENLHLR